MMSLNQKRTRHKSLTAILCVGTIFAIGMYFFVLPQTNSGINTQPTVTKKISTPAIDDQVVILDSPLVREEKTEIQDANPPQQSHLMPDQLPILTTHDDLLWYPTEMSESEKKAIAGDLHGNIENRAYITLNRLAVTNLKVDDQIEIPIPQHKTAHTALIKQVIKHGEQSTSWTGHLSGYGNSYPIIISQNGSSTIATIDTPNGQYMLEANGENARLTPVRELKKHIDYSKPDFIELDEIEENTTIEIEEVSDELISE